MLYQNNKVTDVIAVLFTIKDEYKRKGNYHNTTELRKSAVRNVAESELRRKRYDNEDSAQKTIHDACARRLRPEIKNIVDFDRLVDHWLRQHSARLKDILLSHSENCSQRTEVSQFFEQKILRSELCNPIIDEATNDLRVLQTS
jgi:hypothetical protein